MKLIINGKNVTKITGEPFELKGEIFIPLTFLEKFKNEGITLNYTASEIKLDITAEAVLKLLSPKNPFPANLGVKIETDENNRFKAKAELSFGDFGKASIDQTGKVEAGFNIKL